MSNRHASSPGAWGAYALSALVGSALTLAAIELRHRHRNSRSNSRSKRFSSSSVPSSTTVSTDVLETSITPHTAEENETTKVENNIDDHGDEPKKDANNDNDAPSNDAAASAAAAPRNKEFTCQRCQQIIDDKKSTPTNNNRGSSVRRSSRFDRPSFSGSFNEVDGDKRHSLASICSSFNNSNADMQNQQRRDSIMEEEHANDEDDAYTSNATTTVHVLSEDTGLVDPTAIREHAEFDAAVVSKISTLNESKLLLHRTRSVSALASRLMAAPDEESCYAIASKLLVPLFHVDRASFVLKIDADHIIIKGVAVQHRKHATKLGLEGINNKSKKNGTNGGKGGPGGAGVIKPIKDTMVGTCAITLEQQYCPKTSESKLETQRMMHTIGINSILATPILVNGNKFAGAIVISMTKEDAFREYDRILIMDIASMLGANSKLCCCVVCVLFVPISLCLVL